MNWLLAFVFLISIPQIGSGNVYVGLGQCDMTPKIGTPSAGYRAREGAGMTSIHDPLMSSTILLKTENKLIALCGVDNLGFTHDMVKKVISAVKGTPGLESCEVYLGFSHTHSGGGAFLNFPPVGELLAGKYDPDIAQFYIDCVIKSIVDARQNLHPAKVGFGYTKLPSLVRYRSTWPENVTPPADLSVIKITHLNGEPLAVFFSYAIHPTVLSHKNRAFSADFVGFARQQLRTQLGGHIFPLFFNGAQGDLNPNTTLEDDEFSQCQSIGNTLADAVSCLWKQIETTDELTIDTWKDTYAFIPAETPMGFKIDKERYETELNLLVFNKQFAFLTMPGELSCVYDLEFQTYASQTCECKLGLKHLSILGLVNDSHGYIITPEAWKKGTHESRFSFAGQFYGDLVQNKVKILLQNLSEDPNP
jgi:hypothetical protein